MKKLLSILMSAVMVATCLSVVPAYAKVCYDSDNPDVTSSTHTMLNISGTDNNKAAFDFINQINTVRTANGLESFTMDEELMEAAMLRARELYVYPDITFRPNGERFDYIVDMTGMVISYILTNAQYELDAVAMANTFANNADQKEVIITPELISAGIGCFTAPNGVCYWVFLLADDKPINPVTASDYAKTESRTVKIAVRSDIKAEYWDNVHQHKGTTVVSSKTTPATKSDNGKVVTTYICDECSSNYSKTTKTIYKISSVKLNYSTLTYNGQTRNVGVTAKDSKGNTLVKDKDYTVTWDSGRKNVGKYACKVKFKGNYSGSETLYLTINPKISLSKTSFTYNGKTQKPTVTVKDANGKAISSKNYTVTYSSGCKNVGKYKVTIKFKNGHSGTYTKEFKINPKGTSVSSVSAGSKNFTVKWKKQATQTTGYQIQYATNSKFTSAKTVTVTKNSTTSKKISKLKAKKKYYVRVRTYKTVNGTKYYSAWSKAKTVKTKK